MVTSTIDEEEEVDGIWGKKSSPQLALCPRDKWQKAKDATKCSVGACEKRFGFFERRHHCRQCGRVVCSTCSKERITVGAPEQEDRVVELRVCRDCADHVKQDSPVFTASLDSPKSVCSSSHSGSTESEPDFINFTLTAGALNTHSELSSFKRRTFAEQKRSTSDSNIAARAATGSGARTVVLSCVSPTSQRASTGLREKDFPIRTIDETEHSLSESVEDSPHSPLFSFFQRRRGSGSTGNKGSDTPSPKSSPKPDPAPKSYLPSPGMCLNWDEDCPGKGLFYAFGTECGKSVWRNPVGKGFLKVTSSAWSEGSPESVLDPLPRNCWSASDPKTQAWICIELPESVRFTPSGYSLRHGYIGGGELRNWSFMASEDGVLWIPVRTHHEDSALCGPYCTKHWPIKDSEVAYRFFKIVMTGTNTIGGHQLSCSGFELYGSVASMPDMVDRSHWLFAQA